MIDKKEIAEARTVALEVLRLLEQVQKQLRSARNWGFYDMLGGRFFSSLIKHGKIDKAETLLRQIQSKLTQLQKELNDLSLDLDPSLNISGFQRFTDIVFDNIIFDWLVQNKIHEGLRNVALVEAKVQRVLTTLDLLAKEHGF